MSIRGTNMKLIHAYEIFDFIQKSETPEELAANLKKYGNQSPINYLLSMNFNKNIVVDLPSGIPETEKLDATVHPDMMHPLATQITRMRLCFVDSKLSKIKKEKVFLDIIECIPLKEVEVLVSCKDKALTEMYPAITKELVESVFPSFVA